jgi:NADPH:quinone reductase-like Zn-dependent oxidoreductase
MRAIWITKAGGPQALQVRESADPEPGRRRILQRRNIGKIVLTP